VNTSNLHSAAQAWYVRGLNPAGDGRRPPDDKEALRSRVAGHLLEASCSWFCSLSFMKAQTLETLAGDGKQCEAWPRLENVGRFCGNP